MTRTCAAIATALLLVLSCISGAFAAEDWRGDNRLSGVVIDKNSGKGVPNATLKLRSQKGSHGGPDVKTDANGKWAVLGLGAGGWDIDVDASGYVTRQLSVAMQQGQRLPPMKIEMEPQAVQEPQPAAEPPHEELKIGGQAVTKEIAAAVEAGNAFLGEKKFKEAVAEYEKVVPALPNFMPLKFALARAYYGAAELKKAIAAMDEVYKADPSNAQNAMLFANMLLEDGQLDRGKGIIEKLPAEALTDPTAVINIGIVLMNKKQPAAAVEYFTKAIAIAPNSADGYYYRGLATIQMGKAKQAKSDLEKVVQLAPESDLAKDAKEYLKSIK